jgi:SAM-dependent methyltransferase
VRERPVRRVTRSKLEARHLYDRLGRWYDLFEGRWERQTVGEALMVLAPQSGQHLLEIGPGTGWALVKLAEAVGPTGRLFAVNFSPGVLQVARDRAARAGLEPLPCALYRHRLKEAATHVRRRISRKHLPGDSRPALSSSPGRLSQ